ncbi:MAG: sulfotransferase [Pseudomonadota bacterium]
MSPSLKAAIARHRSGDLVGAIAAYQKLLLEAPGDGDALHFLGMAQVQSGAVSDGLKNLKCAVDADPKSHLFNANLGKAALKADQQDLAREAFQTAVNLQPADFESWNNLGGLQRRAGQLDDAQAAYAKALTLKPHPAVALNLGLVEKDRGERNDARAAFRRVIEMRPGDVQARLQLAALDSEDGDFEASSKWLLEAENQAPNDPRVLAAVLTQRGYTPSDEQLARASALLNNANLQDPERARLGFGLGRALQRAGQHNEAWTACAEANEIVARAAPFDSERLAREVTRLKASFTPDLVERLGQGGVAGDKLVFILGLPRSGTTLAEQVLASHPDVHGADERPEIPALVSALGGHDGTYPESLETLAKETLSDRADRTLKSYAALAPEAERVVDKLPFNFSHAGLIAALFPKAHIVHCVRDLRDVFISCFFTEFTDELQAFRTRPEHFADYARHYRVLMAHWEKLFPDRIHTLRYENVVANFEPEARSLVAAIGIDWHPNCLSYTDTKRTVRTPSRWQVRQPIYSTSIGRWRQYERYLGPVAELEH